MDQGYLDISWRKLVPVKTSFKMPRTWINMPAPLERVSEVKPGFIILVPHSPLFLIKFIIKHNFEVKRTPSPIAVLKGSVAMVAIGIFLSLQPLLLRDKQWPHLVPSFNQFFNASFELQH